MEEKSFYYKLKSHLNRKFIAGILTLIPLMVTIYVLRILFDIIDNVFAPLADAVVGRHVVGLGFALTIVVVYVVGIISANVIGVRLLKVGDRLLSRMPLVKGIYNSVKQLTESASLQGKKAFKKVVFFEFPRKGMWTIALVTAETVNSTDGRKFYSIFIPTTPNPTAGFVYFVPVEDCIDAPMGVDEGFKLIISTGIVSPPEMRISK